MESSRLEQVFRVAAAKLLLDESVSSVEQGASTGLVKLSDVPIEEVARRVRLVAYQSNNAARSNEAMNWLDVGNVVGVSPIGSD